MDYGTPTLNTSVGIEKYDLGLRMPYGRMCKSTFVIKIGV